MVLPRLSACLQLGLSAEPLRLLGLFECSSVLLFNTYPNSPRTGMSCIVKRAILQVRPVTIQQVRFARPNIRRPAPPHFDKLKLLEVARIVHPKDTRLPIEKCRRPSESAALELSPLDKIYADDMLNWARHAKLVAVFGEVPINFDEIHKAKILFFKANMRVVRRNKNIVKEAFHGTEYENLLKLCKSPTVWVFGSEANVAELLRISGRVPYLTLLAGVVDNRILSVSQLKAYSMLPDLETARAHIVQTLNSAAQNIVQGLTAHQTTLSQHLQSRIDQVKEPSSSSGDTAKVQEAEAKAEAKAVDTDKS